MKSYFLPTLAGLITVFASSTTLHAEIEVWLSVKFILHTDGTRPTGSGIDVSTGSGFQEEVKWGNQAMGRAGRGFRLRVVEYLDIRPPVPPGQPADYWYNLPARSNRQTIETAAVADETTWRWHTGAINIYVNNSASGSCSFVGSGASIALGGSLATQGTVVHEIGHFFNLSHTHANDPTCPVAPPIVVADGDNLAETILDHNCLNRDGLSQSNFNGRVYASLTPAEQAQVDSSWLNVMSYHQEEVLLPDQMDRWTTNASNVRLFACLGQTWFVAPFGSDANSGAFPTTPFATIARAQASLTLPNDVILLRSGVYGAPANRLNVPATYCATRGPVFITAP
jgi:hypothetical protein